MRFLSLTVENYRQFYGNHKIRFGLDDTHNLTVIYGANGSGKTALLNAFTWTFYGEFSPDFEQPKRIINEHAWSEANDGDTITARVIVEFEHEQRTYTAERTVYKEKTKKGSLETNTINEPTLEYIDIDGEHRIVANPKDALDQLIPERLHRFFFFNGERIDEIAKDRSYTEIQDAVKSVLGLEVVERSIRHLSGTVKNKLRAEWAKEGTDELKAAQEKFSKYESELSAKKNKSKELYQNKLYVEEELEKIKEHLRSMEQTKDIQQEIDKREKEAEGFKISLREIKREIMKLFNDFGFYAFVPSILNKCENILNEARKRGEIPSGIKQRFVSDLLERGLCICERPLLKGDDAYNAVAEWQSKAGMDDVEEEVNKTAGAIERFRENHYKFFQCLNDLTSKRSKRQNALKAVEELISEKEKERRKIIEASSLKSKNSIELSDLPKLEKRNEKLRGDLEDINQAIGSNKRDISRLEEIINNEESKIKKLKAKSAKEALAKRRVQVVDEVIRILKAIYDHRCFEVRSHLQNQISELYQEISFKPYEPKLTEDYHLILKKDISGSEETVAKSTGENQILSLSFIGSLVHYARNIYEESTLARDQLSSLSFKGGIYPLVIDSPFGQLDDDYREKVANGIPKLAPQVIIFVSKSQGLGVVKKMISPHIDHVYTLSYSSPKKDVKSEKLLWNGSYYPYIERSNDNHEYTKVLEITNG